MKNFSAYQIKKSFKRMASEDLETVCGNLSTILRSFCVSYSSIDTGLGLHLRFP